MTNEITLNFTKDEAIVLFELTCRFTEADKLQIEDQSEERVLWNICANLEKVLVEPFSSDWKQILQNARDRVRDEEESV